MLAKNTNFENAGNFYIQLARDMENRILATFKCPNLLEESYQSAAHVFFHFPVTLWEDFLGCLERHQTAHRIYKCSCNSSAKASSSTWLVESRGNINKKRLKITAKSSKVQSFTNKHPTSQDISMICLHLSLCPQASKSTSSPCSQNESCAVPQKRCSLFWA